MYANAMIMVVALFFVFFSCCIFFCLRCMNFSLGVGLLSCDWLGFEFCMCFDDLSCLFIFMLLVCGSVAIVYCVHYFGSFYDSCYLLCLMSSFLFVMGALVFSGSLLFTLILWEYLGFVSFLLILYYANSGAFRASVVTLVSSRFGDVGLFVVVSWLIGLLDFSSLFVCLCLFLVVSTKSACYPFMSWLIEAMRAPTPVSSLVHSSTLVAAGVWFLLRYDWLFGESAVWFIYTSSLITIIFSGLCACCFVDLKKIVAFSTCNNISWCLLYYISGDVFLSVCQLITHGLCKCCLFMSVGDLMCSSDSSQSVVGVYNSCYHSYYGTLVRSILVVCLSGMPFIGVFFSKHYFISCFLASYGLFALIVVLFGFILTYVYTFRFLGMLLGDCVGLSVGFLKDFVVVGGITYLCSFVNFLVYGCMEESQVVSVCWGLILMVFQLVGSVIGVVLYESGGLLEISRVCSIIFGCDSIVGCFYNICGWLGWFCCLIMFRWEVLLGNYLAFWDYYYVNKFFGKFSSIVWVFFGVCLVSYVWFLFL